jgi:hypothetical protein
MTTQPDLQIPKAAVTQSLMKPTASSGRDDGPPQKSPAIVGPEGFDMQKELM